MQIALNICLALVIIVGVALIMAAPTMWLWNGCAVDAVTVLRPIGFWQALGLNFLSGIIFKTTVGAKGEK